jgi:hypothetical protein
MESKLTERGFQLMEFRDRYDAKCSVQKSSIMGEHCIWLGCEHETFDQHGSPCGARMHVTQELAAQLIPILQHFVDTGELPNT